MNWFTKSFVGTSTLSVKAKLVEEWGGCEHVEKDSSCLYRVDYENDSFGREGYCLCEACAEAATEREDNELHTCVDCKSEVPLKDGVMWKWYDFYAAQGDEPLFVCNTCRTKEKHLARRAKDRADYEAEFPDESSDNDYQ